MSSDVNDKQLAPDSRQLPIRQLPIEEVDNLADKLAADFDNPLWRKWYCGVINEFGVERVEYWYARSMSANAPGRLFSHYVKQARLTSKTNSSTTRPSNKLSSLDHVYVPKDDEITQEEIARGLTESMLKFGIEDPGEPSVNTWSDVEED